MLSPANIENSNPVCVGAPFSSKKAFGNLLKRKLLLMQLQLIIITISPRSVIYMYHWSYISQHGVSYLSIRHQINAMLLVVSPFRYCDVKCKRGSAPVQEKTASGQPALISEQMLSSLRISICGSWWAISTCMVLPFLVRGHYEHLWFDPAGSFVYEFQLLITMFSQDLVYTVCTAFDNEFFVFS